MDCRLISTTIIGIAGVLAQQLSDSGSSTVQASGGDSRSSVWSSVYQLVDTMMLIEMRKKGL